MVHQRTGESALDYEQIYVSGGRIGTTLKLSPLDLAKIVRAEFADFIVKKEGSL